MRTDNNRSDAIDREDRLEDRPLDPENAIKVPLPILTGGMKPSRVKHRSYQWLICIPVFFFLFTSILCGGQVYLTNSESVREFEAIKDVIYNLIRANCESQPITAIQIIDPKKNEACPLGYTTQTLGNFGGSHPGCYDSRTTTVFEGSCPSGEGYSYINPVLTGRVWNWRDHHFCVKRLGRSVPVANRSACQADQKACKYNPGYICVDSTSDCPITDIKLLPLETPVPGNYHIQSFGHHRLIYVNDPYTPRSLTGFLLSLNTLPCLDPFESPYRNAKRDSNFSYPLMIKKENGCKDFGFDYDSVKMDAYSERDVYKENSLGQIFGLPRLAEFTEGNNITLNAQFTKGVKDTLKCDICQDRTYVELKKVGQEIWETHQFYVLFSKFGIVLVVVMIVTAIFNICSYCLIHKDVEETYLKVTRVNTCVFSYMLGHFLTAGILSILNYYQISGTINQLNDFIDGKCFTNNNINQALEDLHKDVLATSLEMTLNGGVIIAIAILANTGVVIANYILSGIKKPEVRPTEEVRPLRAHELELGEQSRTYQTPSSDQKPIDDEDLD